MSPSLDFTLPRAGGSDAIASGEGCTGVIAARAPPSPARLSPEEAVQLFRFMQSTKLWRVRLRSKSAAGR